MKIFFSCIESKDPYRVYLVYFQYWIRTIILLQGKQRSIDHVQHASIEAITCVKYPKLHEKNINFIVSMRMPLIKTRWTNQSKVEFCSFISKMKSQKLKFWKSYLFEDILLCYRNRIDKRMCRWFEGKNMFKSGALSD